MTCCSRLRFRSRSPDRGQPATRSLYRQLAVPFGRSAYVIRYRVDHARSTVVIVRIWHGREQR
jgi:plasmid stabilization system protein ParE